MSLNEIREPKEWTYPAGRPQAAFSAVAALRTHLWRELRGAEWCEAQGVKPAEHAAEMANFWANAFYRHEHANGRGMPCENVAEFIQTALQ